MWLVLALKSNVSLLLKVRYFAVETKGVRSGWRTKAGSRRLRCRCVDATVAVPYGAGCQQFVAVAVYPRRIVAVFSLCRPVSLFRVGCLKVISERGVCAAELCCDVGLAQSCLFCDFVY